MHLKKLWKKDEEHRIVPGVFRRILLSYILSSVTYAVGPMVDGAVIANFLGVDAVAAAGMVWPAVLIYALVGGIISGGSRNLYTELMVQGKVKEANRVFTLAQRRACFYPSF